MYNMYVCTVMYKSWEQLCLAFYIKVKLNVLTVVRYRVVYLTVDITRSM